MLDNYFCAPKTLRRLRIGLSGPYIDSFADSLERDGYAQASAVRYLRAAAHFGCFVHRKGGVLANADTCTLDAFGRHFACCRCPQSNGGGTGYHARFGVKDTIEAGGFVPKAKMAEWARVVSVSHNAMECSVTTERGFAGHLRANFPPHARVYYLYRVLKRIQVGKKLRVRRIRRSRESRDVWDCVLSSRGNAPQIGGKVSARCRCVHELSDKRDREDSAYAMYAEDKEGNVYRVTPVPFFNPDRPARRGTLVTLEVTGNTEKGAIPAHFLDLRQACGSVAPPPRVGAELVCRVERSRKLDTLCVVGDGWTGVLPGRVSRSFWAPSHAANNTSKYRSVAGGGC